MIGSFPRAALPRLIIGITLLSLTYGSPLASARGRSLNPRLLWHGDNRQRLDQFIAQQVATRGHGTGQHPPVAAFDMDNTIFKNDLGDATVFWSLRHDKVLQPPSWKQVNHFLTAAGIAALRRACDDVAAVGAPLLTSRHTVCATEIVTIYLTSKTTTGESAFAAGEHQRMEPSYAFGAQLLGGHTKAEVREYADSALQENLTAPIDSTQAVGNVGKLPAWIRIYDQQKDLLETLQENGFGVYIISASPQPVVEAAMQRIGIATDHIIGIRLVERGGRLTYDLQGCGDVPDGQNTGTRNLGNRVISYKEGKRCWLNKVVYGVTGAAAFQRSRDPARRPRFAAGDADSDVTFLQDASGLRLVLNRNQPELMCNAYHNAHGTWLVNPMFIAPRAQLALPYPCATAVCKDGNDALVPCRDEDGVLIPTQTDRAFGAN